MFCVVAEYSQNTRCVIPGPPRRMNLDANLSVTRSGSTYYYMADGLGSVRNVVDSSETVQDTYDYYAFGNTLLASPSNVTNPYRYTAREFESGSVLDTYYYRNRYYVSQLGIFMSRDAQWADPQRGWGYVGNRATFYRDPFGHAEIESTASQPPQWNWPINCLGYLMDPHLMKAVLPTPDQSANALMSKYGWTCTPGISAKNCQAHCREKGKREYSMFYYVAWPHVVGAPSDNDEWMKKFGILALLADSDRKSNNYKAFNARVQVVRDRFPNLFDTPWGKLEPEHVVSRAARRVRRILHISARVSRDGPTGHPVMDAN